MEEVNSQMALYLAAQLEKGKLDYLLCFMNPKLFPLKEQVDAMLIVDGFDSLIVVIPA